jgi:peptide/nickel transport system substrate-binding protein
MSRTVRWQVLLIAAGMALVGTFLTYLTLTYTTTDTPTVGGTYVEGVAGVPQAINPLLAAYNDVDRDLCALVFEGLTRFNSRGQVEPSLAQGWEASLDGLTYIFHLRRDVRWHDGATFNADDVLFTVNLLQDPDYPGPPDVGALWRTVQVTKDDDATVRFILAEPYAPFLDYTTIGVLPVHLLAGTRAADLPNLDFNLAPVGTGPFEVEEVEAADGEVSSVLLSRNPRYHEPGPLVEHIRFRFYPSYQSVFRAYQAHEVEGISQVTSDNWPRVSEEAGLKFYSAQMARCVLVFFNLAKTDELPALQEAKVRQGLLYGLDRQGMIDQLLNGQGMVANSPIVAGTWAYDEAVRRYPYDPAQAGALLDEAGWWLIPGETVRSHNGQPLSFTLLVSTDPIQTAVAQEVARQWGALNVQATVVVSAPLEVRDALEQRNYQAALVELALPGDPDPYPLWHQTQITVGQNYAGFDHRQISEIIETARIVSDPAQRKALYAQFQDLFTQEVPAVLLYYPFYTYGVSDKVLGVQIGPLMYPSDRFVTVNKWYMVTQRVVRSQSESRSP